MSTFDLVVVNDFAHVNGGAAKVAIRSATAFAERGYQVTFLACVAPVAPELERAGVRVVLTGQHDIKSDPRRLRAAVQGIWNRRAFSVMSGVLAGCRSDRTVVHVHGWTKALSSSAVTGALRRKIPVVVTLHDYFYACPNGGFFNFQQQQMCSLKPLSAACIGTNCDRDGYAQKLWRVARQYVQNYGLAWGDGVQHFITLSDLSESVLRRLLPPTASLHRIPNPVDVEQRPPVPVAANSQFVAVGRLSAEKGIALLARAAAAIGGELTVIGDGPCRQELLSLYRPAQVTGWQTPDEALRSLRKARALVFPSLWYEAQPLAVLEAAAQGIPAIVPDSCAARELVEDGVTGLWFRGGDASDLAAKMRLLQDDGLVSRLGEAAYRRYWSSPYTLERHVTALEACYRSMLEQRSCSGEFVN